MLLQLMHVVTNLLTHLVSMNGWARAVAPPHYSSSPDVDLAL